MAPDAELTVNGLSYSGWTSIKVTRSMESLVGSFDLEITDKWHGSPSAPWPIREEDVCIVKLLGQTVITGYVDKREISEDATSHTFSVSGRDRAGALVDCSAVLDKMVFRQTPLLDLATKLCAPFGVKVSLQAGQVIKLAPRDKLAVNIGDTAWHVLERACRMTGFVAVSDGNGAILLSRAGSDRADDALEEGVNVKHVHSSFDFSQRYFRYLCLSANAKKVPKKDTKAGAKTSAKAQAAANKARAEAFDEEVTRTERVLLINPEDGANKEYADARVQWEATVRAGKSEKVVCSVQGWGQENGLLWPVNALVDVDCPRANAKGQMLITEVRFGLDNSSGRTTEITCKRPDAFTPQPRIKRGGTGGQWKEIAKGV